MIDTFAHNLRFLMKIRNITQTQIAKDCGIHRGTARAMILGKQDPRLSWVQAICDKYSVNFKWLTEMKVGE